MSDGTPRIDLASGENVVREDGKEFVVDERRSDIVIFKAKNRRDPDFFAADDRELAQLFSEGRIVRIADSARNVTQRTLLAKVQTGLAAIEPKHQAVVRRRLVYVLALRDTPRGERSGDKLERILDEAMRKLGDAERPCARIVRAWHARYIAADHDPVSLLPHHAVPRRRARRLDPIFIHEIEQAIDLHYMNRNRWSAVRVYQEFRKAIDRHLERHPDDRDRLLKVPPISALRRAIGARDRYHVMAARLGSRAADLHFLIKKKGKFYSRPLEAVMIDATQLDLIIKDDAGESRPRPWLIIVLDVFSRMVIGFALTIEPPSAATALQALRNAMAPKSYVADLYPFIKRPWPCYGKPEEVIADVGREMFNEDVTRALREIFADLTFTAVERPEQKPQVERMFRTINQQLIHMLPGTTRSNPKDLRKGGVKRDPAKEAMYTLADLRRILHRYFIEDYPMREHRELGCTPWQMWTEGVAKHPVRPPPPDRKLALLLAKTVERELQHYGINIFDMVYATDELSQLRPRDIDGRNPTVTIKYDPDDIACIWVLDDQRREYIRADAELADLLSGMSEKQWRHIRAQTRERLKSRDVTPEDYYNTACDMFKEVGERTRVKRALRRYSPLERSQPMPFGSGGFLNGTGARSPDVLDEVPRPGAPAPADPDLPVAPLAEREVSAPSSPTDIDADEPAYPDAYDLVGGGTPDLGGVPPRSNPAGVTSGTRRPAPPAPHGLSPVAPGKRSQKRSGRRAGSKVHNRKGTEDAENESLPPSQIREWGAGGES